MRLMRYHATFSYQTLIPLEDYFAHMLPNQKNIYYIVCPNVEIAKNSPYLETFKGSNVPVLILTHNIDEFMFEQMKQFRDKTFINIENHYDAIKNDLG
mmetsp:Transcript_23711/g.18129  ORF Transcript_23711/g.18129 Transcript_23711/m.18129 type:complete len:98 (+) Transcript_23711:278-571(+)